MQTIYTITGIFAVAAVIYCVSDYDWRKVKINPAFIIIIFGLFVRFTLMGVFDGYDNDIRLFMSWADNLYKHGFSQFYFSESYTDYPPGYMYILYLLGALRGGLSLSDNHFVNLLKIPAILCDIITSCMIYRIALRKFNKLPAFFFGLLYALNPAVILNSVIWGQIDSVHTMLLFLSIMALSEKRRFLSYYSFTLAVLVKPQSLALSPIFIYDAVAEVFGPEKNPSIKRAADILLKGIACISFAILLSLPFINNFNLTPIINLYKTTLTAYPYASVNAYNLYSFIGANWVSIETEIFQGFTYFHIGFFFLALISVYAIYLLNRGKGRQFSWFLCAGVLFALTFLLSVMMHERYIYPSLVFFLTAYIYKQDKRLIMFYVFYSALAFVNGSDVLYMIHNGNSLAIIEDSMRFLSMLNIVFTAALAIIYPFRSEFRRQDPGVISQDINIPGISEPALRLGWHDLIAITLLMAVYSAAAFSNLGDKELPHTAWHAAADQYAVFELKPGSEVKKTAYLLGARNDKLFTLSVSDDCVKWRDIIEIKGKSVFRWHMEDTVFSESYARITSLDDDLFIHELAFLDKDDKRIPISVYSDSPAGQEFSYDDPLISDNPSFLCDEKSLVPDTVSFLNGTYFDEIYHARTAYEFIHHLKVYEWTHPPLGKAIISMGVLIFGMTPFGWRIAGVLFGVLMLPAIYIFAKKIFRGSDWAFFAAFLFAVDFMHFAQTRIATIDVYVTFFIILMYMFIYLYSSLNFYECSKNTKFKHSAFVRSLIYLLCCGISTGLAAASKWEGIYAMFGLPVIFFYTLYRRFLEYKWDRAEENPRDGSGNIKYFRAYTLITLACSVLFFIVIPASIYILSYIPYLQTPGQDGLNSILKNQSDMFNYHSQLESTHPYSSYWFQWPFMLRPIYYYSGQLKNGLNTGITSFGNPAVWWMGIAALLYCIRAVSKRFNMTLLFLLVAYASQYLPWMFVSRTTYIYHYFPSVPFVILMITYMFKHWTATRKPEAVIAYMLAALLLFIAFYPALSGHPIPMWYVNAFLKWMPTWSLS